MKHTSRPKSAAAKDIDVDIDITEIFWVRNIDIVSISAMAVKTAVSTHLYRKYTCATASLTSALISV